MSHHLVEACGLRHAYPDGTVALDGVDFTIRHGESVAVVGANGAGKSTLLAHLNGHLRASAGEVRVGGLPVLPDTLAAIRRAVGVLFQDPDDQLFMPTVAEDVAFGPQNLGLPPAEVEARVAESLARVGAYGLRGRPPYRLSGGEKRRVALAAVLAMGPDVLVLDEPSAGLDPRARRQLLELLRQFAHTRIVASHDLDLVLELCPRTLVLCAGRLLADGPTAELLRDDALLARAGLERPLSLQACPVCSGRLAPAFVPVHDHDHDHDHAHDHFHPHRAPLR